MNDKEEAKMSQSERSAFEKLKKLILKDFGPNAVNDRKIVRFLIARDFVVSQSYTMLKMDLEWRKLHRIDTILQDYHITELYEKHFTMDILGFDKEGFLLILSNLGRADYNGFSKSATDRDILRHCIYEFELCEQKVEEQLKATGKSADKWTVIANMEGFSFAAVSSRRVLNRWIETVQTFELHYPEKLNLIIAINVPTSYQILLGILKPFVPHKTLEKIQYYGKDGWHEELLKRVDPEVLPAYLGGERTDPNGCPMCYSFLRHGGPVPEKLYTKNSKTRSLKNQKGVHFEIIQRRSKFNLPIDVKVNGSVLKWEFETEAYDVGFGLFYKDFDSNDDNQLPLIPLQKIHAATLCEKGSFKCEKPGIYILTLDNSYSFLRSKNIYYRVSLITTNENDIAN